MDLESSCNETAHTQIFIFILVLCPPIPQENAKTCELTQQLPPTYSQLLRWKGGSSRSLSKTAAFTVVSAHYLQRRENRTSTPPVSALCFFSFPTNHMSMLFFFSLCLSLTDSCSERNEEVWIYKYGMKVSLHVCMTPHVCRYSSVNDLLV